MDRGYRRAQAEKLILDCVGAGEILSENDPAVF